jgi:hypothetical protein
MTPRVTKSFDETLHTVRLNWDFLAALALFFASFALYARTAVPGVMDGDGGEFQTNIYNLGVSHTGYPLYFLLAKVWTLLMPAGTIAYRANVFSSLFGALTLVLIYALMRALTERRAVALLTAVLFGLSRVQWSQALIPDVYTLNSFFIVLVLWLAVLWRRGRVPLGWVALAYGLSLTHHRTMIWFAPALAVFVLWGGGRAVFQPRALLVNSAALLLPLLLYLYIPLRGDSDVGVEYHARNTINLFALNVVYDLRFGPPGFIWDRITQVYLPLLIEQFTIVGFALGLGGIFALASRRVPRGFPQELPARQWLLLLGLAHLAETAFAIVFWVVDSEIFFIPSYLTFLFFVGVGFAVLCDEIQARVTTRARRCALTWGAIGIVVAVAAFLLWTNFARNDQSGSDQADTRWQAILAQPLEANATIMGPWEDLTPLEYYQYVEGARRDLKRDKIIVYRDQLKLAPQGDVAQQVRAALQNGAHVYLTRHPDDTETLDDFSKFDLEPIASLWRVSLRQAARDLTTVRFDAGDELQALSWNEKPRAGDFVHVVLDWAPDTPLERTRLVWQLRDAHNAVWAEQETLPFGGREFSRGGKTLRDTQGIFVPPDAPPGRYTLALTAFERDSQNPQTLVGESNVVTETLAVSASENAAAADVLRIPRPLQAPLNDVKFLGYGVDNPEPRGGDVIEFSSWWQGLTRADGNLEIKFRDANGAEAILYQGALLPSSSGALNPNQIVRARQTLIVPPTAAAGFARILLTYNGLSLPDLRLSLDESRRTFREPIIPHPQLALVGGAMQLLGYKLERTTFRPGETLALTLIWNANKTPDKSYKVFTHLLDANGVLRAQQDSIPQRGVLPTNRWFPGEYVTDEYAIALPPNLAPGDYRLAVGMYDQATDARVPLRDANGTPLQDNRVLLDDVIQIRP